MKRNLSLLALLCLMLFSCKAPMYSMGMSEQDFTYHNSVSVVSQSETASVYKKINYPFGAPAEVKFFYFRNGKLVRVDSGIRSPDVVIDQTIRMQ